jgi:peptidyl-prolyl cis-trans isomerase B (cyclophilin B)
VSPNQRERAYEKRRYEKWQARQQEKLAARRQQRRIALIVGASLAVVALIAGIFFVFGRGDDDAVEAAPQTPTDGACPAVGVTPPAKPKTFAKAPAKTEAMGKTWAMTLKTTCGDVTLSMDGAKAPQAVSAMLLLGREGFFDGSPCHRLTTEGIYVLQCGDPTGKGTGGPGFEYGPVENAPKDNVYPAGTVAMARQGGNGSSMGSQFFLVYKDSTIPADAAGGYTVLGTITSGLDVVTKVAEGGVTGDGGDGEPKRAVSITGTTVAPG